MSPADSMLPTGPSASTARKASGPRDPRLDFFRGLAMLIIFIAHVPWNSWSEFIPARWGASDAAEMFVFCSGYAAAIAFGGTFVRTGFGLGVARILLRCWQIYWAHIGLFFSVLVVTLVADSFFPRTAFDDGPLDWIGLSYAQMLNLTPVLDDPATAVLGLFSFTWVPNYFDILPMYFVILLMVPIVMALQRIDTRLAVGFIVGLYITNRLVGLELPADPWTGRVWFFNPFGWQLLFFTGFFLARGWLVAPPFDRRLLWAAALFVLVLVPVCQYRFHLAYPWLESVYDWLLVRDFSKMDFHLPRYLHFMALAYLALYALAKWPRILRSPWVAPIIKVGQQALPTFMTSMVLAWISGLVLDQVGRAIAAVAFVNLTGLATVIGVAYLVGWYKSEPWRRPAAPPAANVAASPVRPQSGERSAIVAAAAR